MLSRKRPKDCKGHSDGGADTLASTGNEGSFALQPEVDHDLSLLAVNESYYPGRRTIAADKLDGCSDQGELATNEFPHVHDVLDQGYPRAEHDLVDREA